MLEIFKTKSVDLFDNNKRRTQMPVNEFLNEQPSISRIFKINESFFYQLLEDLIINYPNVFGFNETAGQRIIELKDPDKDSLEFIDDIYTNEISKISTS